MREKSLVTSEFLPSDTSWAGGNVNSDQMMQEEEQIE